MLGVRKHMDVVVKTEFDLCDVAEAYVGKDDEGQTVLIVVAKVNG